MSGAGESRRTKAKLLEENECLRVRLDEAEQTLEAIRSGEVDALVVRGPQGERLFSLSGAERIYRAVVETMNEAALMVDPEGTILFCNQRFCALAGIPTEQAVGQKVSACVAAAQKKPLGELLAQARTAPVRRRLTLRNADGDPVPVQIAASPLEEEQGGSGICLVVTDLTELETSARSLRVLREHQEALEASEARFRALVEVSPDAILVNQDGRFAYANPAALRLFGAMGKEDLIGRRVFDFLHPDDCGAVAERIQAAMAGRTPPLREARVLSLDGRTVDIEATATATDWQGRPAIQVLMRDITERRATEQALRRSEGQRRVLIENVNAGVALIDENGRFSLYNGQFLKMFGLAPDMDLKNVNDQSWGDWQVFGEDGRLLHVDEHPVRKAALSGRAVRDQLVGVRPPRGGDVTWMLISAEPIFDGDGRRIVICTYSDITELRRAQQAEQEGRARLEAALSSMTDAVFISDADGRFIEFNDAFATFHRFPDRAACARTLAEYPGFLDVFLPDGTLAPLDQWAVPRALRGETAANAEYTLRRKDTGETWVGSYGFAPIRDERGDIVGSVVAGRDVTEVKRAQSELAASRRKFQALIESTSDFIWEIDRLGRYTYCSPQMETLWGFKPEEMLGRTPFDLTPADQSGRAAAFLAGLVESPRAFHRLEVVSYDGRGDLVHIEVSGVPFFDPDGNLFGYRGISRDVSERKKAEAELERTNERLARVLDSIQDHFYVLDREWKFAYTSRRFTSAVGKEPKDFVGRSLWEMFPKNRGTILEDNFRATMDAREVRRFEVRGKYSDAWYSMTSFPSTEGITVLGVDITERKRAEQDLAKLNRTLRALSNLSQALVRAEDEAGFLQAVCRIVIEDCGHAMTWIGYARDDEARSVQPVASAGFEEGYLETLAISWADTERGRGPTGTAIRTGEASLCTDMLTDPRFEPWRAEALKRGYASSIVLPLRSAGNVFGAISIYSREPDPFTEDEIALLRELADDVSHGVATLRAREAHRRAEEALAGSEARYRSLFEGMSEGFSLHEIVCDDGGVPVDYRFLEVNPAFERLTGLRREDIVGRLMSEVLPGEDPRWIRAYGDVALTGEPARFENYAPVLRRHFEVFAYRPAPRQFAVVFMDVSARKVSERTLAVRNGAARILAETESLEEMGQRLVQHVGESLGWVAGELWLVGPGDERLRCGCNWERPGAGLHDLATVGRTLSFARGEGMPGLIWEEGRPIWIEHPDDLPDAPRTDLARKLGLESLVGFPLHLGDEVLGVAMFATTESRAPEVELLHTLEVVGSQVGQFIRRKRAEATLAEHVESLEVLAVAGTRFLEPLSVDELFRFLGAGLRALAGSAVVVVSEYQPDSRQTVVRALEGPEDRLRKVTAALGGDLVGMSFAVSDEVWDRMVAGGFVQVEGGLHELSFGRLPLPLCRRLEAEVDAGVIFVMPLLVEGQLMGTVAFVTDRAEHLEKQSVIESFVNQAALALSRKQAEEALRASEEMARNLVQHAPAAIYELDVMGSRFVRVNDVACQWSGYSRSELLAMSPPEFLDEEGRARFQKRIERRLGGETGLEPAEYRIATKDGHELLVEVNISGFVPGSDPQSVLVVAHDITGRRRAAAEVARARAEAERRAAELGALMDAVPAAVLITRDPEARLITANRLAHEMLRVPLENPNVSKSSSPEPSPEYRPTRDGVEVPPEDLPVQRAARGEVVRNDYYDVLFDNGDRIHLIGNAQPLWDEQGVARGGVAAFMDITERRQAEETLRKSEARLRLAQSAAGAGVWDWDMLAGTLDWSDGLFRIFGLEAGKDAANFDVWRNVMHPDDREGAEHRLRAAIEKHSALVSEYRIVLRSGDVRWITALGDTVYGPDGTPQRMSGICIDITERKQAEVELRRRSEELRAANDELTRFNRAAVNRELRMIALKKEINDVCARHGQPPPYAIGSDGDEP